MSSLPTLAYWEIRGYAQPIRNLLHYSGVQFNDKVYQYGPGTTWAESESVFKDWYKEKFTLGLDFPNLPYWIDGEVKLTQTTAILKYLARKNGLIASDVVTLAKQEMIEQQLQDYINAFAGVTYSGDKYQEQRDKYLKTTLPQHLEALSNYLGDNQWFTAQLSYVDFYAYEMLDWFRLFSPSSFDKFTKLKAYLARFESLPAIKKYQSSGQYKSWPVFAPISRWGWIKD